MPAIHEWYIIIPRKTEYWPYSCYRQWSAVGGHTVGHVEMM